MSKDEGNSGEPEQPKTTQLRIRQETAQRLRYLYAMSGDKMIDIIGRLVDKEYLSMMEERGEQ